MALESVSFLAFDTRLGCLDPNLATDSDQVALIDAVSDIFQTSAKLEHTIPFWKLWPKGSPNYRKFSNAYDVYMRTAKKYINESLERSIRLQVKLLSTFYLPLDLKNQYHNRNCWSYFR